MKIPHRRVIPFLGLGFLLALVVLVRCWNFPDVFVAGKTFFVDADCYSRMTRVREVLEHPGRPVHFHRFENWPEGTAPHTTAPLDYLIAGLSVALRPWIPDAARATDLAGAVVSPLLGLAAAAFLWGWAGRLGLPYRVPTIVLFATSPILVHGTVLGRPDHQSLLILCMAVALGAEAALLSLEWPTRAWGAAAGLAWGLGLWVSLYEPAVLLVAAMGLRGLGGLVGEGRLSRAGNRERWLALAAVLALGGCVDGWRWPVPEAAVLRYFPNWSRTIGELASSPPWSPTLLVWTLALLPLSPLLLAFAIKKDRGQARSALFWLGLLGAMFALTCWQARWGYFLALVFAMSLPWQLAALERRLPPARRWAVWAIFAVSFWPLARAWSVQLGFGPLGREGLARRAEERADRLALYDVAGQLRGEHALPVLAPWWQSPALAYWSGQPCVAGSSHESLPGTVDSSRFYLGTDWPEAARLLARRKVACVVAYDPGRVIAESRLVLGEPGNPAQRPLADLLYTRPHSPPPGLELVYMNAAFRVFLRPEGVEATKDY